MEPPMPDRRTGRTDHDAPRRTDHDAPRRTDHDAPRRTDHDGPRRIGPYRVLAALDVPGYADEARRCLARDVRTGRTVVLTLPHAAAADDAGYRVRFRAEAENSRRLRGPWVAPVVDVAPPGAELPWVAHDCFPALTLPGALAAHGGPLPEDTVRALGAALAETLAVAHANGLVHAGISPQAVLLTRDGPRLTGYGLLRARGVAAPHTGRPAGAHGDVPAGLPPEQHAGEPPRPHGDVYALGAVLAYAATGLKDVAADRKGPATDRKGPAINRMDAATGRKDAGLAALPPGLRETIAACLSPDPAHRPQPATLIREFRSSVAPVSPARLPGAIGAALADQAARHPADAPPPEPVEPADRPSSARQGWSRRSVVVTALGGAAGLALGVGGTALWRAVTDERPARPEPLAVRGVAPAPLWRRRIETEIESPPLLWGNSRLLVPGAGVVTAVRVRDGQKAWTRDNVWGIGPLSSLGGDLVLRPGTRELIALSARTGQVTWVERSYDGEKRPQFRYPLAADGRTLWFLAQNQNQEKTATVVAYDLKTRKERWRTSVPGGFGGYDEHSAVLRADSLLLSNRSESAPDTPWTYLALGRHDGAKLWTRTYKGVHTVANDPTEIVSGDLLITFASDVVSAHEISSGAVRWRFSCEDFLYTDGALHGRTLYVTDGNAVTYAIDVVHGRLRWRRRSAVDAASPMSESETVLSHSGRTVFQVNASEVEALDAADGSLRWRFAPVAEGASAGALTGSVLSAPGVAVVRNDRTFYALPVD
ncbi:outer membrane protein assembly factor BamB family protein [Streptomyces sp. S465]|uniref:outer membrane protein assembly factor BamB family protein n=1 Tax=Streptomyces sp. S465 TaxID=2979468 RepID=UPI0022A846E4|nr:PQQ-binding-like beta-propeller repeat protein [Streptomyces sp. S465]WAP58662.1 PQQ-binding-like beta-propeller repeat protein [Streptomyces sp. S465]